MSTNQVHPPQAGQSTPGAEPTAPLWFGERGPAGPPPAPSSTPTAPAPAPRRQGIGSLLAVALLSAGLASGGTYAAVRLGDDPTPSAMSSTSDRGADPAPVSRSGGSPASWTGVAAAVTPSVVSITAEGQSGTGEGSGVVISKAGEVLTNNHVVAGASKLTVTLSNGTTYAASVRGTDPSTDLAVVAIQGAPSTLTPVAFGDSASVKVGDPVMAVGNPLGLSGTVTTGVVSAVNRPVTTSAPQEQQSTDPFGFPQRSQQQASEPVVTNAIQTSAAINPGNSGGALVDASGRLVGINSSIAQLGSSGSGQSGNIGIGFAIPVNEARSIADQLIKSGKAQHAYLGLTPTDGSASDGSATRTGALVRQVASGTPAAKAGLRQGDVVIAVDGDRVESAAALVATVRATSVGEKVTLTVLRSGKEVTMTATLAARPSATG